MSAVDQLTMQLSIPVTATSVVHRPAALHNAAVPWLHLSLPGWKEERDETVAELHGEKVQVLLTTDMAARGVDNHKVSMADLIGALLFHQRLQAALLEVAPERTLFAI